MQQRWSLPCPSLQALRWLQVHGCQHQYLLPLPGESTTGRFDGWLTLTSHFKSQRVLLVTCFLWPCKPGVGTDSESDNWILPSWMWVWGKWHKEAVESWELVLAAVGASPGSFRSQKPHPVLRGHSAIYQAARMTGARLWFSPPGLLWHLPSSLPTNFVSFLIFFFKFLFNLSHSGLVSIVHNREPHVAALCPQW